jgi:hypothetical protein
MTILKVLKIIEQKYSSKVEIITKSIPYKDYINLYKSHIVLDQVFSYDQGYNALEEWQRQVVFTGAETEFGLLWTN